MMWRLVVAALVMVSVPALVGAEETIIELTGEEQARAGIVTRPVLDRLFGDQIRVVGRIVRAPGSTITVNTILSGRIERILATPGTSLKAGDALLRLHSHELHRLQSDLLQMRETVNVAEARLAAGRQLLAVEGISRIELDRRRYEFVAAKLKLNALQAELGDLGYSPSEIEEVLDRGAAGSHLTVVAPTTGVVLQLKVEEHEWVQGFAPLVVLGDPKRVEVELQIPPDQAARVSAGDLVEFVPVGRPEQGGRARVLTTVPQVDPDTRTLVIRARIENLPAGMVPGVFLEGTLTHGEARSSLSVPESAVSRLGDADVVFVRVATATFEARPVRLGALNGSRYEVLSGVFAGEEVVVQGAFSLKAKLLKGSGAEE